MNRNEAEGQYAERMVPEDAHARTFWEHVERYRFAAQFVRAKRVLDIACGEGFGAAGLARAGAASVIGVDISPAACDHARRKYQLDARVGDAHAIPLPERSVDVVTSFETIEHVADPGQFIEECARVLVPGGTLIVSTPNRPVYNAEGTSNPFHVRELDEQEFVALLQARFKSVRLFTQFPRTASAWSLRSLPAERSPWLRVRGFWRLSSWFCPAIRGQVSPALRAAADQAVLGRERFPSTLFNPFVVRPYSAGSGEQPYYLIAVAEDVRPSDRTTADTDRTSLAGA